MVDQGYGSGGQVAGSAMWWSDKTRQITWRNLHRCLEHRLGNHQFLDLSQEIIEEHPFY